MKRITTFTLLSLVLFLAAACGSETGSGGAVDRVKEIKSGPAGNNLTATLSNRDGVLRNGKNNFTLTFTDQQGNPVDVGSASLNFFMPAMGTMAAMTNPATLTTTATPGVYAGTTDLEMSGEWQAQIAYDGPAGTGKATLPLTAQ
ncbi:MAG TPA: FixH family protein [Pyrinomonadaceae bacterium]|nr:FixH family protein [Pyrinomonadaceae bacterium]